MIEKAQKTRLVKDRKLDETLAADLRYAVQMFNDAAADCSEAGLRAMIVLDRNKPVGEQLTVTEILRTKKL